MMDHIQGSCTGGSLEAALSPDNLKTLPQASKGLPSLSDWYSGRDSLGNCSDIDSRSTAASDAASEDGQSGTRVEADSRIEARRHSLGDWWLSGERMPSNASVNTTIVYLGEDKQQLVDKWNTAASVSCAPAGGSAGAGPACPALTSGVPPHVTWNNSEGKDMRRRRHSGPAAVSMSSKANVARFAPAPLPKLAQRPSSFWQSEQNLIVPQCWQEEQSSAVDTVEDASAKLARVSSDDDASGPPDVAAKLWQSFVVGAWNATVFVLMAGDAYGAVGNRHPCIPYYASRHEDDANLPTQK